MGAIRVKFYKHTVDIRWIPCQRCCTIWNHLIRNVRAFTLNWIVWVFGSEPVLWPPKYLQSWWLTIRLNRLPVFLWVRFITKNRSDSEQNTEKHHGKNGRWNRRGFFCCFNGKPCAIHGSVGSVSSRIRVQSQAIEVTGFLLNGELCHGWDFLVIHDGQLSQ